ncbi:hypothetical protein OQA88_8140 [Cercophora sp. LCS_1]
MGCGSIKQLITAIKNNMSPDAEPGASALRRAFDERGYRKLIPYDRVQNPDEYRDYELLMQALKARKPSDKPRIVVITDVEQDYDDLLAIIFLSEMHRLGAVELAGFVTNHGQPLERAKFLRSIVHLLGLGHIEVARGTIAVASYDASRKFPQSFYELRNKTFANASWNNDPFRDGSDLIESLARDVDQGKEPLTVLLISCLKDISDYFDKHKDDPEFIKTHFKKFVSQGGYHIDDTGGGCELKPNLNAANNTWNLPAAENYTDFLAKHKLPSDAWSREAAKASVLDVGTFTESAGYGPIGAHMSWVYLRQEFKFFWDPYNAPFMPRLNPEWYLTTRLVLVPGSEKFKDFMTNPPNFQTVLPETKVIAYDGCAAIGAVGDDVMRSLGIMKPDLVPQYNKQAHGHRLFGKAFGDLGGIDGERMRHALRTFLLGALKATHEEAEKLIKSADVEFEVEKYEGVKLGVFLQQAPHLKQARILGQGIKDKDEKAKGELEQLMKEKLPSPYEDYPKVPKEIPYELLYEDAMKGIKTIKD